MSKYIDADTMIKAMPPIMEWLSKKAQTIDIDLADDGTLSVEVDDATKVTRVLVEDGKYGDLYYADRPQGWIPCSERLPEKAGHYLCSFRKANRIDSIYVDLAYCTGGRWYGYLANEINAWKPLPEPWKGADDEV